MSLAADLDLNDARVEFIADYVLKTMKLKPDKWTKMYSLEENKAIIFEWFEKPENTNLLLIVNPAGSISLLTKWPQNLKGKGIYFVKKGNTAIAKDTPLRTATFYGDLSYSPLDQLSAFVDEVFLFVCIWYKISTCTSDHQFTLDAFPYP